MGKSLWNILRYEAHSRMRRDRRPQFYCYLDYSCHFIELNAVASFSRLTFFFSIPSEPTKLSIIDEIFENFPDILLSYLFYDHGKKNCWDPGHISGWGKGSRNSIEDLESKWYF